MHARHPTDIQWRSPPQSPIQQPSSSTAAWPTYLWQPAPSSAPTFNPLLPTPAATLAGEKRKLSSRDSDPACQSDSNLSPLDALRKRQRRFRSHSSLSDSDDQDDSPKTPLNTLDDAMDWAPESTPPLSSSGFLPNQPAAIPPWRIPSPSQAIHRLELLREAKPPSIATYTSSFNKPYAREPPPSKVLPMSMQPTPTEYVFSVHLPGYNLDNITVSCKRGNVVTVVADLWHLPRECCHHWDITFDSDVQTAHIKATMDRSSDVLTLTARRYRRYVPIEYQVEKRPSSSLDKIAPVSQ